MHRRQYFLAEPSYPEMSHFRSILCSSFGFNVIVQLIFVGINISAAFWNRNVVSRTCLHRVCLLLNVELDRIHAVWVCIQTVESKSETDYCELISHTVGDFQLVLSTFSQAFEHSCIAHSRKFSVPQRNFPMRKIRSPQLSSFWIRNWRSLIATHLVGAMSFKKA